MHPWLARPASTCNRPLDLRNGIQLIGFRDRHLSTDGTTAHYADNRCYTLVDNGTRVVASRRSLGW